jgi:hypothetical protein
MRKLSKAGALVAVLLLVAGCSAPVPTATPNSPLSSPLNSPLPTVPSEPVPTQDPTLGSAVGKITEQGQPLPGRVLYLAEIVKDANGKDTAAGYDRANSPRTLVQADGSFTFVNVPPGRYSIVMDLVRQAFMLKNPKDQSDLVVEVNSGGQADFGTLDYDQLPK